MQIFDMIINGRPVRTDSTFDVVNPATGEVFARVQAGDASHVDQAVAAARAAFPAWSRTPDAERQRLLHALGAALEANMPALMELVTKESGKPLGGLNGVGSGMEVGGAIAWTHVTADLELPVEVIQDNDEARIEVHRKPLGVVGSITPWNWPLMIAIWHVIPALRAGNTVVIKPASVTPTATIRFVELANAILPPGVLNIVTGESGVGSAIAKHPDINKIVFTGSTPTGKNIMQNAAGNLKRLTLELGGNDAGIVLPDVDPKAIAPKLFGVGFHNNGQTCACLKRLYVHDSIYEEVCAELARIAKETVVGDGLVEGTQLGPVQNKAQLEFVQELVEDARAHGARILSGGKARTGGGFFFEPTVIADAKDGMRVVDEEQFGPVLPVIRYSDIEEVIARANDNDNGLGGSIWSNDRAQAAELALRLECGTAWVNEHGAVQPDAPFGGVKQSGLGVEFGRYGLEEYTSIQTLKIMKA
ncbi:aldehyde dehydrogenase family protein [Aromatoleum bremense]|uniref:Aldehyde dehydrogenase family protein n=1 Tax=Aromatoleum bremense TaxID=76115 RepID=A0ABX1NV26_9RHOO|nr:aldehyde dehydrogenase family protein [Aromatoleum bremense]NMG15618.1 aldehyde dehydrogenase family protein [Aromatoleum bremense]QTQ30597.1 Aldehyde dehydrogenase [Aromatoleum bremense]